MKAASVEDDHLYLRERIRRLPCRPADKNVQGQIDDSRCAEGGTYWSGAGESPGQKSAAATLYEQCMRAKGWQPEPEKFEDY